LLVCGHKTCRIALSPAASSVNDHLRNRHDVSTDKRREIASIIRENQLQEECHRLRGPTTAPPRPDNSPYTDQLQLHDGFQCESYSFRTISKPIMVRHFKQEHSTVTTKGRYRRSATSVLLQSWIRNPPWSEH
ncbi:hypothetical protein EV126DRAFT_342762, partial [Verticillium dahliae]